MKMRASCADRMQPGIAPVQALASDVDDPADDTTIVHPKHAMRQRELRSDRPPLSRGQQEPRLGHGITSALLRITPAKPGRGRILWPAALNPLSRQR